MRKKTDIFQKDMKEFSRRDFLKVSGLAGSGLVIGMTLSSRSALAASDGKFEPNAYLTIHRDGTIIIMSKNPEIGQGIKTSMPQIIAEELEVDWKQIEVQQGTLDGKFGDQFAGGSTGINTNFAELRKAGASAREMLVEAASRRWKTAVDNCYAREGFVHNKNSNEKLSYGELVDDASKISPVANPKLKEKKDYTLIGKSISGVDNHKIVTGKAEFGLDARPKGMLVAVVERCPVRGGKAKSFDATEALKSPGVQDAFIIDFVSSDPRESVNGVALVADSTWHALKGRKALKVEWDYLDGEQENDERIRRAFEDNISRKGAIAVREDGNVDLAFADTKFIEATYEVPFLSHVPMEPMNYIADVRADGCDIWGPTQVPGSAQDNARAITGLPVDKIKVRMTRVGGGFGRRLSADYAAEAVLISKKIMKPVQVVWTREDDIRNDLYRPAGMYKLKGGIDKSGRLTAWHINASTTSRYLYAASKRSPHITEIFPDGFPAGFVPNFRMEYTAVKTNIGVGAWRAPGHNATAFVDQSFIDELAHLAGKDPVQFRLGILGEEDKEMPYRDHGGPHYQTGRLKNVIRLAAEKSNWSTPAPKGIYRGFAAHFMFGAYVAEVVSISLHEGGIKVENVIVACDCGIVVNRSGAMNQLEGGIIDGLSATLYGALHVEGGKSKESNFDEYKLLRMKDAPTIEVHLVDSSEKPEGLGEMSLPVVSAALCNAIFAATGKRIRKLPVSLNYNSNT
jgi:isoquinoline 1-oxidoreductase beta subunit